MRRECFKFARLRAVYSRLEIINVLLQTFHLWLQVISYDSQRGGVSVITEKGDITTSYLLIQNADLADSGRYSCSPSNADVASVRVHVLNGNLDFFAFVFKMGKNPPGLCGITHAFLLEFSSNEFTRRRKVCPYCTIITMMPEMSWNHKSLVFPWKLNNPYNARVATLWKTRDNNFCKLSVRALISGEHPEAMQTGSSGKSHSYYIVISLVLIITLYNYIRKELLLSSSPPWLQWPCGDSSSSSCLPPKDGSSSATFLINFKLETAEGVVCNRLQRIFHRSERSWLSKQHEHCTENDRS